MNFPSQLKPEIIAALKFRGFESLTPIQEQALPVVVSGKDLIAKSKTGSGKTGAFAMGILQTVRFSQPKEIKAMVLCPTRELCSQVAEEIRKFASQIGNLKVLTLSGGTPIGPQFRSLEHGADIIVGTPGRVLDHIERKKLWINAVDCFVLDEADRMLEMGFQESIDAIVEALPRKRQTLLFSATFPDKLEGFVAAQMNNPSSITVKSEASPLKIEQLFYRAPSKDKLSSLLSCISSNRISQSIIFCETKASCSEVASFLFEKGLAARAIHGDLEQWEREETLCMFENQSLNFLVATDVAARGIDIKDLQAVINFDLSKSPDTHRHRIGRTGRADMEGLAISLISEKAMGRFKSICIAFSTEFIIRPIERVPTLRIKPIKTSIRIEMGKKNKLRPGDILGSLTKNNDLQGSSVGKIKIFPYHSIVAVSSRHSEKAVKVLSDRKVKGKAVRSRVLPV